MFGCLARVDSVVNLFGNIENIPGNQYRTTCWNDKKGPLTIGTLIIKAEIGGYRRKAHCAFSVQEKNL